MSYRSDFRRIGPHLSESISPDPDAGLPELPDSPDHSCPNCDEELAFYGFQCERNCVCRCHNER